MTAIMGETAKSSPARGQGGLLRAAMTVGGFTLISRLTGFTRDILIAALLGATGASKAADSHHHRDHHYRTAALCWASGLRPRALP